MIQGFAFQVNNFQASQNRASNNNNFKNSENSFEDILNTTSKDKRTITKDNIVKQQNTDLNTRRAEIQNKNIKENTKDQPEKEIPKESEKVSKEEKTVEELVENLSEILVVFQNVVRLNEAELENINPEDINLEISVEELESLIASLKILLDTHNLGDGEKQLVDTITNLETMIENVASDGEIEVLAEEFILELKEILDSINSQNSKNTNRDSSSIVKNPTNQLENLVNIIENSKSSKEDKEVKDLIENKSKQIKLEPEEDLIENKEIKIKIVVEKKEGINLFDKFGNLRDLDINLGEEINPNTEKMPINILSTNENKIESVSYNKSINNSILNTEQYLNIDKADILKQITNKVKSDYESQLNEIKIKLSPEHLGELTIKVSLERGVLSARALVENTNIKQLLESNLDELKNSLKEQGMKFDSLDVSVGKDSNFEEKNPNFFMNNKRFKGLKTNIENPVDMGYYEEDNIESSSGVTVGESSMDITV